MSSERILLLLFQDFRRRMQICFLILSAFWDSSWWVRSHSYFFIFIFRKKIWDPGRAVFSAPGCVSASCIFEIYFIF
jgi:hypothetical protein